MRSGGGLPVAFSAVVACVASSLAVCAEAAPLEGTTLDFAYDARDTGHHERSYTGRVFVPDAVRADPRVPRPMLVFLHGLNREGIKHRFLGGSPPGEPDVRAIVADLIARKIVPPMLVAGPSAVLPEAAAAAETSWPAFDLDRFLEGASRATDGAADIDLARVVVAGHSAAGCNPTGGIYAAMRATTRLRGVLIIDTCLLPDMAGRMVRMPPATHVVATWQTISWDDRPFGDLRAIFARELAAHPAPRGVFREVEELRPTEPGPHNATVHLTLERWLPRFLATPR